MSVKLKQQEIYQKKLDKLIKEGRELSSEVLELEHSINFESLIGEVYYPDPYDSVRPAQYGDLTFDILKWQKQCQNLLALLSVQNTIYSSFLPLLEEEYLKGFDIQKIVLNLEAILEDLSDGIFGSLLLDIEAQSVINHLEQAYELFDEGKHILAGIIGLCSLESFLREMSVEVINLEKVGQPESIQDEENNSKSLENVEIPNNLTKHANFLKSKGRLSKAAANTVREWAKTRDRLVHGDTEGINAVDIKNLLSSIKVFVVSIISN